MSSSNEIFFVDKNYLNVDKDGLTRSSNDIDLACKYFVNNYDNNNFKKELMKLLEEGLKEGTKEILGRLYSIEAIIENGLKN